MRTSVGLALFLSALTLPAQNASAQLAEKKVDGSINELFSPRAGDPRIPADLA
jgi:hypothetical protein